MIMKLTSSERRLLQLLLESKTYRPIESLATMLGYSKRSTYVFMKQLSEALMGQGIEPPRNVRGQGYSLSDAAKAAVLKFLETDSDQEVVPKLPLEERNGLILLSLMSNFEGTSLNQLSAVTGVTHGTALNDFSRIAKQLKTADIQLTSDHNGHHLVGSELKIRNYMYQERRSLARAYAWTMANRRTRKLIDTPDIHGLNVMINDWLNHMETISQRTFSDDTFRQLEFYYALVLQRVLGKHILAPKSFPKTESDAADLRTQQEFQPTSNFLMQLGVNVNDAVEEVYYLESLLLGSQLNSLVPQAEEQDTTIKVREVTKQVVANFKQLTNLDFHNQTQLVNELAIHLTSAYYRIKYHRQYTDGMVTTIRDIYPDIYTYTKMSIRPFEQLTHEHLSDNELSLIAIYFGAQMYHPTDRHTEALLVCSTGLGTSRLLKTQLEDKFPDLAIQGPITKRTYDSQKNIDAGIVLSTVPLKRHDRDVLVVHPVMNEVELEDLRKRLVAHQMIKPQISANRLNALLDVIADNAVIKNQTALVTGIKEVLTFSLNPYTKFERGYQPLLSELVNSKTIQFASAQGVDWQQGIAMAAQPLLDDGSIRQSYVDAMIENVKENGPYINIGDRIAFAHARPEKGVEQLGMSLLHLDQPIELLDADHPIQLIFVLAAVDDRAHLKALSELATMLGDNQRLQALIAAQNATEIEDIILKGEH